VGLVVAGSIEALKLMVFSHTFDATEIVTGLLATVLGAEAATAFCQPRDCASTRLSRVYLGLAILFWLAALMNHYWRPFDFSFDSGFLASRLRHIEWLPLADAHHGNDLQAILHLLDIVLLFLVLGTLCALESPACWGRGIGPIVVAAAFATALILETGQLFLPTRYFCVTDILCGALGGWLGCFLIAVLRRLADSPGAT
jgi:glycopeptide antibiotics resistance protein